MKKKIPDKLETKFQLATRIAAHFGVAAQTALQWFDAGCPFDFDAAVEWKTTRNADATIKSANRLGLSKIERAQAEAKNLPVDIPWEKLSADTANLCDIVADLHLAGLTTRTIQDRLGLSPPVILRIVNNHPRTKDVDKDMAVNKWRTIRRLAQDAVIDSLSDPDQLAKLKPSDRILAAGIAHDKVKDDLSTQLEVTIKAKIESMSYEELLNSIPADADTIDAEFTVDPPALPPAAEPQETSPTNRKRKSKPTKQSQ